MKLLSKTKLVQLKAEQYDALMELVEACYVVPPQDRPPEIQVALERLHEVA